MSLLLACSHKVDEKMGIQNITERFRWMSIDSIPEGWFEVEDAKMLQNHGSAMGLPVRSVSFRWIARKLASLTVQEEKNGTKREKTKKNVNGFSFFSMGHFI